MSIGKTYEAIFRELIKKKYPVVIRVPDYSSSGSTATAPGDYQCIKNGRTDYYEVKHTYNQKSFPLSNISEEQIRILRKIHIQGGVKGVYLFIFMGKKKFRVPIKDFLQFSKDNARKSLPLLWLLKYTY